MSKRTLIRCKKCDRPLGDTREDKIRVMQFYKNEKGYTEIKVTHDTGGKIEISCSKCGTKNSFTRGEIALGMEYKIAKK